MEPLLTALLAALQINSFAIIALGVFLGLVVGAIPGLGGAMLIALLLPVTFFMTSINAISLLVAIYVGSVSGGLVSATILRMPGTPSAIMTILDSYPMAVRGEAGRALGIGIFASFIGGLASWFVLALLTPPLAEFALRFGPYELFALVIMAIVLISSVGEGSFVKSLCAAFFGVLVAMVGADSSTGQIRFNFGFNELSGGLKLLPVLLGLFVVSQVITDALAMGGKVEKFKLVTKGLTQSFKDVMERPLNLARSAVIGTWVGILPGVGSAVAAIASYTVAKNTSKTPEVYGTGSPDGIVAAETANNASVNGALVPLVAMGIPGSTVDAILIGALLIHNVEPGPGFFQDAPEIAYGIIAVALVANFLMLLFMLVGVRLFALMAVVPKFCLLPSILAFCGVGVFALGQNVFDMWVLLAFGLIGYLMRLGKFPIGPFIIAYILAPMAEREFRSGMTASQGDITPLFTQPISLTLVIVTVLVALFPLYGKIFGLVKRVGAR